jgi:hypothetical protein
MHECAQCSVMLILNTNSREELGMHECALCDVSILNTSNKLMVIYNPSSDIPYNSAVPRHMNYISPLDLISCRVWG